jgi:hypothetical protein
LCNSSAKINMKTAIKLTALGLLLAGISATAQTPPENHWDISKVDVSKLPPASDQKGVTFDKDIQPLFKASCVRCHGERRPRGGLRLDSLDAVLKGGHEGKMVIPGDSKKSLLLAAAARIDDNIAMPPKRRGRGGPGGPGGPPPGGSDNGGPPPGQPGGPDGGPGPGPGGGTNGPGGGPGGPGRGGPPPKPLTTEEAGLVRAWIDQGAK